MPSSRRAPRRRERPDFEPPRCGGRERPPYGAGETRRPPGKMQPPRCTVGADSISARFAAAQGSAGGMNPAPTGIFFVSGKPEVRGKAGRADMESAPTWGVCGGAGFAEGINPAPTNKFYVLGPPRRPRQHAPLIPNSSFPIPHSPFSSSRSAYPTPCTVRILSAQPSLRRRRWMWVSSVRVVSAASSSPQTASYR